LKKSLYDIPRHIHDEYDPECREVTFSILAKLRFYGQNGRSKFDHDHPQDYKIFMVKMVNPNLIMTMSTIPDFYLLKLLKYLLILTIDDEYCIMVLAKVVILTMAIRKIRRFYGHGHG
jgi:hypothetical protein